MVVTIPYWEWAEHAPRGLSACQAYLHTKLALFQGQARDVGSRTLFPFPLFNDALPLPTDTRLPTRLSPRGPAGPQAGPRGAHANAAERGQGRRKSEA